MSWESNDLCLDLMGDVDFLSVYFLMCNSVSFSSKECFIVYLVHSFVIGKTFNSLVIKLVDVCTF